MSYEPYDRPECRKILIAMPPAMREQIDFIAQCEHRTRSDLIREALRRYIDTFRRVNGPIHPATTITQPREESPSERLAALVARSAAARNNLPEVPGAV